MSVFCPLDGHDALWRCYVRHQGLAAVQTVLIVDGNDLPWHDGESYIFDETYMHSAYNNTDKVRLILMTDIARPLRSKIVQKAYYYFGRYFNRMFAIDNIDSKYSGFGNKMGKGINAYRALLRKFKTKNKPLYVLTKITATFSILGFIAYFNKTMAKPFTWTYTGRPLKV